MERDVTTVGTLYIDGHVRVYHGGLTKPPRRYVSRERLCLRGTSDYWVNDATGRPFFMVEKAIDPGLIKILEKDIVPRLLKDIPNQPIAEELDNNPYLFRFILVFAREGYSPAFFHRMWENHRIGCMTYHKHPDIDWPEACFTEQTVTLPSGEVLQMLLAERGSLVGSGKQCYWMREVRKLRKTGHQSSIISTAYELSHTIIAASMFSRWCQEKYNHRRAVKRRNLDITNTKNNEARQKPYRKLIELTENNRLRRKGGGRFTKLCGKSILLTAYGYYMQGSARHLLKSQNLSYRRFHSHS